MVRVGSPLVRPLVPLLALVLLLAAACDGGGEAVTTTSGGAVASSITTTTMDEEVCSEVTDDAVAWVEDLVGALEGVRYEDLVDRARWPEALTALDARGADLQARSDGAGCDAGLIRGAVVSAATRMEAEGRTARLLLDLLAPGS